ATVSAATRSPYSPMTSNAPSPAYQPAPPTPPGNPASTTDAPGIRCWSVALGGHDGAYVDPSSGVRTGDRLQRVHRAYRDAGRPGAGGAAGSGHVRGRAGCRGRLDRGGGVL